MEYVGDWIRLSKEDLKQMSNDVGIDGEIYLSRSPTIGGVQ